MVLDNSKKTIINKRTQKGIWHNLYEFPFIETEKCESVEIISDLITNQFPKNTSITHLVSEDILHKLSHQHLHIRFWKITTIENHCNGVSTSELKKLPVPIVIHNFIERNCF